MRVYSFFIVICLFISNQVFAGLSGSLSEESIEKRLAPDARVKSSKKVVSKKKGLGSPKKIYKKYCGMCHDRGVQNSPVYGKKSDWTMRIAKGKETLYKNAWDGINLMPPKGNCVKCTPEDINKTVDYILDSVS